MLISMILSQGPSPDTPPRGMTASAPAQASVMAGMLGDGGHVRARRPAPLLVGGGRGGRGDVQQAQGPAGPGQPRPQHGPDPAGPAGDEDDRHGLDLTRPGPGWHGEPGSAGVLRRARAGVFPS